MTNYFARKFIKKRRQTKDQKLTKNKLANNYALSLPANLRPADYNFFKIIVVTSKKTGIIVKSRKKEMFKKFHKDF